MRNKVECVTIRTHGKNVRATFKREKTRKEYNVVTISSCERLQDYINDQDEQNIYISIWPWGKLEAEVYPSG